MQLELSYFGILADVLQKKHEVLTLTDGSNLDQLLEKLLNIHGSAWSKTALDSEGDVASYILIVVNGKMVTDKSFLLPDGGQIAFFAAVSGG